MKCYLWLAGTSLPTRNLTTNGITNMSLLHPIKRLWIVNIPTSNNSTHTILTGSPKKEKRCHTDVRRVWNLRQSIPTCSFSALIRSSSVFRLENDAVGDISQSVTKHLESCLVVWGDSMKLPGVLRTKLTKLKHNTDSSGASLAGTTGNRVWVSVLALFSSKPISCKCSWRLFYRL